MPIIHKEIKPKIDSLSKKKKKIDAIKMNLSLKKNQIEVLEPKIKKKNWKTKLQFSRWI